MASLRLLPNEIPLFIEDSCILISQMSELQWHATGLWKESNFVASAILFNC